MIKNTIKNNKIHMRLTNDKLRAAAVAQKWPRCHDWLHNYLTVSVHKLNSGHKTTVKTVTV